MRIDPTPRQAFVQARGRAVRVRGLVQGVGFRPTVWRLARRCSLTGEVWNDAEGVMIHAWGAPGGLDLFVQCLRDEAPPLARIDAIECAPLLDLACEATFSIRASQAGTVRTGIVPDAASCPACVEETLDASDRRHRYPFTNCTHCGPRLSIVRAIPYDRANTSMAAFALCPQCQAEYDDAEDRRFHAQPLACPACGPRAWIERLAGGEAATENRGDPLEMAGALLRQGAILAVKGIGGFHLACDAGNEAAVARLRARKRRPDKPFALMARDVETIRRFCVVDAEDEALLRSPAAPIVILAIGGPERVARSVAPRQPTLGFMLPYTPLHHLLLGALSRPIVLTSGNVSDEPQCVDNAEAQRRLAPIADYGLFHDRDILNRIDDSVVRVIDGAPRILRRARGYAPASIALPDGFHDAPAVLALGGELKNSFTLVKDGQAILSQHMGDLEDAATLADFKRHLSLYCRLFAHQPTILAIDRHPQYLSSRLGREWAARDQISLAEIQHHHAHIASCMAENGVPLTTDPVLGIALDGLGYGDDGGFWGGEFLLADYRRYVRLGCLQPVPMPGGDRAAREPWRNLFAHLDLSFGWERCAQRYPGLDIVRFLQGRPLATLGAMMRRGVNSPPASSCGRLFDAVAAALGICRERASYEGQPAIELEAIVDRNALDGVAGYPFSLAAQGEPTMAMLDSSPMWAALLDDLGCGTAPGIVAARFHRGLAEAIAALAGNLIEQNRERATRTVALSGGAFQNRILLERVTRELRRRELRVLSHRQVPANDGGLSLGQSVIAAARHLGRGPARAAKVAACA